MPPKIYTHQIHTIKLSRQIYDILLDVGINRRIEIHKFLRMLIDQNAPYEIKHYHLLLRNWIKDGDESEKTIFNQEIIPYLDYYLNPYKIIENELENHPEIKEVLDNDIDEGKKLYPEVIGKPLVTELTYKSLCSINLTEENYCWIKYYSKNINVGVQLIIADTLYYRDIVLKKIALAKLSNAIYLWMQSLKIRDKTVEEEFINTYLNLQKFLYPPKIQVKDNGKSST